VVELEGTRDFGGFYISNYISLDGSLMLIPNTVLVMYSVTKCIITN